ncbi:glutaredoxin domain-containing protein [Pseudomonas sp. NPDC090202]|uniref:glutaredoxin domain-containing protein n=1 Tax=unclassified Pseudomonas TaxID=196821 RepID=UPI00381A85E7
MNDVTLYTGNTCPCCTSSRQLLASKGITPIEINVEDNLENLRDLVGQVGRRSYPQIFIGIHHIGGFHDMAALDRDGHLDALLGR